MNSLLKKSIRLRPLHVAILAIMVSVCIWTMMRYFEIYQAKAEWFLFDISLTSIKQGLKMEEGLRQHYDIGCRFLDKPDWLEIHSENFFDLTNLQRWVYDAQEHRLIYSVNSTHYFQSNQGPSITLDFICQKGKVSIEVSPYQWCRDMQFWGCNQY